MPLKMIKGLLGMELPLFTHADFLRALTKTQMTLEVFRKMK